MRHAALLILALLAWAPPSLAQVKEKMLIKQGGVPLGYASQVNCVGTSSCSVDPTGTVWTFNGTGTGYTGTPGGVAGNLQINGTGTFDPYLGDACDPGTFVTAVDASGQLTCLGPATSMTTAGTGSEIQLRLDDTHLQAFGGSSCALGWHAIGIASNGQLSCAVDTGTVPAATASTLGTVSAPTCPAGQHYSAVNGLGALICTADSGGGGGGTPPTYVDNETPAGAVNGINITYGLLNAPSPATSLRIYLNGVRLRPTIDYTLAGSTITMLTTPQVGDWFYADYRYGGVASQMDGEVPSGTIDGSNPTFTTVYPPVAGSLHVYLNGVRIRPGTDYTVVGNTITMIMIPQPGDWFNVDYRYAP
jgi:hypothetical protein